MGSYLGVTIDELEESLINDDEAASAYLVMAKALEDREQTKMLHETFFNCYLAITCEFEIEENDYKNIHKNEKTVIPKELLEYFAVHTIGTARGILFYKTESTPYNYIIIPPLNVSEMIKDDMVIF